MSATGERQYLAAKAAKNQLFLGILQQSELWVALHCCRPPCWL